MHGMGFMTLGSTDHEKIVIIFINTCRCKIKKYKIQFLKI